jgi:hypothetical protein
VRFEAIAGYIAKNYKGKVVEVCVGRNWKTAELLADKLEVFAVDLVEAKPPSNINFFKDDITSPNLSIYEGASLVYSIRPPPELHSSIVQLAEKAGADCLIRPLDEFCSGKLVNHRGEYFYVWNFKKF